MVKTPNLMTGRLLYSLFACHLWSAFQLCADASLPARRKVKRVFVGPDASAFPGWCIPVSSLQQNHCPRASKFFSMLLLIIFALLKLCILFSYLFFLFFFIIPEDWPIFCVWSFSPHKTILTFVGIQVNWRFWLEHSNHCNLKIARQRVTFKQKVQKFQFSRMFFKRILAKSIHKQTHFSLSIFQGKLISYFVRATYIDRDQNLLY